MSFLIQFLMYLRSERKIAHQKMVYSENQKIEFAGEVFVDFLHEKMNKMRF
jgi:hypothetical protein